VYLPEILVTPYSPDMSIGIMDCIAQQNWEIMESRFKALHEYLNQKGVKEFFAIAFCWGVWACFKFAAKFDGFKGIAGFHPSFGVAGLFKEDEADIVGSVKCPAFLYPA
jgi:dienelactone hydrolase